MRQKFVSIVLAITLLVLINIIAHFFYARWDLTEDQRYTLSEPAIRSVEQFKTPVIVDVLLDGELPAQFLKLKLETQQLLKEFAAENENIKFNFIDPLKGVESPENTLNDLQGLGLTAASVTIENNGKISQEILFPWAMVNYKETTVRVPLLRDKLGVSNEDRVTNSIQNLEYAFADAFTKLGIKDKKQVAVIKGNGELDDIFLADYLSSIKEYYNIGAITLDSVQKNPQKVLDQLKAYDLALIAKPTEAFSNEEKYVLDQYIVNGGKSIWLIDPVAIELDSLFNETGSSIALHRDLNLKDFFFKYGVRINPVLVNDLYATEIVLAVGEGNSSDYNPVPWVYNPAVLSRNNHPINTNLEALRFQFASSIDTLANENRKTVLYWSSPLSKLDGVPKQIRLDTYRNPPNKEIYNKGNNPMVVLVEGAFSSVYKQRVKPISLEGTLEKGPANKMLIIADGDLIANQIKNGRPLELGYDKWTNKSYGNKEFLVNATNYLMDDTGLINIRNKKITVPFLDEKKVAAEKTKWQLINIAVPVVLSLIIGLFFNYYRKKKYGG